MGTYVCTWNKSTYMVHVSVCGAYVRNTIHGTNVKLPDDDIEMSKHVEVYIKRVTVVIYDCALVGCNKNNRRCTVHALK